MSQNPTWQEPNPDQEEETTPDRPPDLGSRKDVGRRNQRVKASTVQNGDVVRQIMASEAGRVWILDLLDYARTFADSFTGSSATFYNEGRRSVGTYLLDQVHEHDMAGYVKMIYERNEAKKDMQR